MQEIQHPDSYQRTAPTTACKATGFSQDTDGVTRLRVGGVVFGTVPSRSGATFVRKSADGVEWFHWRMPALNWSHTAALMLLEGASISQLIGRNFSLIGAKHRPVHASVPGVDEPDFVEILKAPDGVTFEEAIGTVVKSTFSH